MLTNSTFLEKKVWKGHQLLTPFTRISKIFLATIGTGGVYFFISQSELMTYPLSQNIQDPIDAILYEKNSVKCYQIMEKKKVTSAKSSYFASR